MIRQDGRLIVHQHDDEHGEVLGILAFVYPWFEAHEGMDRLAARSAGIEPAPKRPFGWYWRRWALREGGEHGPFETQQDAERDAIDVLALEVK